MSNGRVDMAGEYFETTYVPEIKDAESKERERQLVQEGTAMWKHRKEEFLRQKHREQREVCLRTGSFRRKEKFSY